MTKKEAKKLLYTFLVENGLATRYYYNCIYHNTGLSDKRIKECEPLSGTEKLKKIMDIHIDDYIETFGFNYLDGFFNYSDHSFKWDETDEGYDFWDCWYQRFIKKYSGKLLERIRRNTERVSE